MAHGLGGTRLSGASGRCEIAGRFRARSVSTSLRARLPSLPAEGRVLLAFRRACIVQYGGDGLLALVAAQLGNGPLNAVMAYIPDEWSDLQPGAPAQVQRGLLRIGGIEVSLDDAEGWEPSPAWERLRANSGAVLGRLIQVWDCLGKLHTGGSLLCLLRGPAGSGIPSSGIVQARTAGARTVRARAREAAEAMWAGWRGDQHQLRAGAAKLAGLGSGLTPAGDDFALGTMLCAWLAHPSPRRYCEAVVEACSPRTTMLSRAFLRSAAAGEFGAPWHHFLEAFDGGSGEQVEAAVQEVLAFGHSSGADALAGFLWMGLRAGGALDQCEAL